MRFWTDRDGLCLIATDLQDTGELVSKLRIANVSKGYGSVGATYRVSLTRRQVRRLSQSVDIIKRYER